MTEPEQPKYDATDSAPTEGMEALIAASRVRKGEIEDGSRVLHNAAVGRIKRRARGLVEAGELTIGRMAKAIGEAKSSVSNALSDNCKPSKRHGYARRDEVLVKIDRYLDQREQGEQAPSNPGFVWTTVAERLKAVANTCVLLGCMGLVTAPAGIGKTLALRALLEVFPGAVLVTIDDETHSSTSLLRAICEALGVKAVHNRRNLMRKVCETLRETRRLLLIDEAHLMSSEQMATVKAIYDRTGERGGKSCPILLAGMPALEAKLANAVNDDSRGATFCSRIGVRCDLIAHTRGNPGKPLFTVEDVKKVFAGSQLRLTPESVRWLHGLACLPEHGSLRACSNAVKLATHIAKQKGEDVLTAERLEQASRLLLGIEGAHVLMNAIDHRIERVA